MALTDFFRTVLGSEGYLCLTFIDKDTGAAGKTFRPLNNLSDVDELVKLHVDKHNSYFCASPYKEAKSKHKENVSDSVLALYADLDKCHPSKCHVRPSIAIESSSGRFQALWLLDRPVEKGEAEELCRRIAYEHAAEGADVSGWDLTQLLRVPGTPNHKYEDKPLVNLVWQERSRYRTSDITAKYSTPAPSTVNDGVGKTEVIDSEPLPTGSYINSALDQIYQEAASKGARSDSTWHVMCRTAELGFTLGQVLTAVLNYGPAQEKEAKQPGWLQADFERFKNKPASLEKGGWELCHQRFLDREIVTLKLPNKPNRKKLALVKASTFKPARVRWGWENRMPVGEITLIPGREGIGKSLFLAWLAAQITTGKLPGEFYGTPRSVLYVASEDSWNYTITPRMIAAGANLEMVYRLSAEDQGKLNLPVDTHLIPETARSVDAAALMLDPIVSLVDEKINVNQGRELRSALEPLRQAAEDADIIVPALAHFNKTAETDVLSKIPGARAWAEVARAAFALAEDKEERHFVASQIKNNLGRLDLPHLTYEIDEEEIQTPDGPTLVAKLRWTGESDVSADDVLSRKQKRKPAEDQEELKSATVAYRVTKIVLNSDVAMTVAEVAEQLEDVPYNTVSKTLKRAADRGKLSLQARGTYGPPNGQGYTP